MKKISVIFSIAVAIFALSTCATGTTGTSGTDSTNSMKMTYKVKPVQNFQTYQKPFVLAFTGGQAAVVEKDGHSSYNNVEVDGTNVYMSYHYNGALYFIRSKDGGHTWEKTTLINDCTDRISMACRPPVLAIACVSDCSPRGRLYCFRSDDGGDTFSKANIDEAGGTGDCYTGIDCDGDKVFIAYTNGGVKVDSDLKLAYSTDKGKTFAIRPIDDTSTDPQVSCSISYNPGKDKAYISYQHTASSGEELCLATVEGPDFTNVTLQTLDSNSECWSNSVVSEGNRIDVVFRGRSGPDYLFSPDDGDKWSMIEDIDPSTNWSVDVMMIKSGTSNYAAYYDANNRAIKVAVGPSPWIVHNVSTDSAMGGTTGRKCSVGVSGSLVFLSYVDNSTQLRLSKSTDGGVNWNND